MTTLPTQTMCLIVAVALGASLAARPVVRQQASPTPQERVAALKQSMLESQTKLRQYAVAKKIRVVIQNAGHRPLAR